MALTTGNSQKISDTTQANGPQPRSRQTSEAAILFDKSVVAKPLNAPEVASIHVKNTENYYRWVNRLHSNGRVYMERKAMGFVNATNEDVDVLVGDTVSSSDEIRCGDVILMKIPFHLWASHVKRNMQTAEVLQRMRGVSNREEELSSDVFADGGSSLSEKGNLETVTKGVRGKITPFIPSNPDAIIDGVQASEADQVRETVSDIRKGIREGRPVRPAPKE